MYSQSYDFSSSHVWMWELDHKESWVLKNWYFWIVVLENIQIMVLDTKEIKPFNSKGYLPWILNGSTDSEAEATILWPSDVKNWLIGKDPTARKDWRQEEGTTEVEMFGWHHWLNGHAFEQAPGVCDGQGGLASCSPQSHKDLDMTEWLNLCLFLLSVLFRYNWCIM